MKPLLLNFLLISAIMAGGNHPHHHDHNHEHNSGLPDHPHSAHDHSHDDGHHHAHVDAPKPLYNALLHYSCEKIKFDWKQLSSDEKLCPICPAADRYCGKLLSVTQRYGVSYQISEWLLPNKICPVSKKAVDADVFIIFQGKKLLFHNEMNRKLFEKNPQSYLRKFELDPAKLGQTLITHKSHLQGK